MPDALTFSAKPNHVWQLPNPSYTLTLEETSNPMECIYAETLVASREGIIAKKPFVFSHIKHPTKNCFVFYRKEISPKTFSPESTEPKQIERQDWMDKDEEDAYAELEAKSSDTSSEVDETLLEMILGYKK